MAAFCSSGETELSPSASIASNTSRVSSFRDAFTRSCAAPSHSSSDAVSVPLLSVSISLNSVGAAAFAAPTLCARGSGCPAAGGTPNAPSAPKPSRALRTSMRVSAPFLSRSKTASTVACSGDASWARAPSSTASSASSAARPIDRHIPILSLSRRTYRSLYRQIHGRRKNVPRVKTKIG
eukprot:scaffold238713_cov27-Tisochrysis_lutea.AAC.3